MCQYLIEFNSFLKMAIYHEPDAKVNGTLTLDPSDLNV